MLTGDHIMNGSTVVIAHPDGSMKDYLKSLELLRKYNFDKIWPGHGDSLKIQWPWLTGSKIIDFKEKKKLSLS